MRLLNTQADSAAAIDRFLIHASEPDPAVEDTVRGILAEVRARGDAAVREFHRRYDAVELDALEVPRREWEAALRGLEVADRQALEAAGAAIEAYHRRQPTGSWEVEADGATLGQRVRPLSRVGICVPAGKAPLPSSLLMAAIPARVAGVRELVACSAPQPDGGAHPLILAAAAVAEVGRFFRIGGAQGVAALAFGTESVPRVDKIVGPGNPYTVAAKRLVFGVVGIESLPGPSEIVVVADDSASPRWVAADLLSQAEHGADSLALLLTPSEALARAVAQEVGRQVAELPRREVAEACLDRGGAAIVTRDLGEACALASRCAPEHVELLVREPERWSEAIENAGAIFIGDYAAEAVGDYLAGPSHILPTGGTARYSSPLSVEDFLKRSSVIRLGRERFREVAPHVVRLARAEGLEGHARAIEVRLETNDA